MLFSIEMGTSYHMSLSEHKTSRLGKKKKVQIEYCPSIRQQSHSGPTS